MLESVLPLISRTFRNNGAEAILIFADDVVLNDSIAAWYHFISSKVRAIENGCYVAHCGNVGISGIISPSGEILVKSDLLSRGVLYGSIFLISEKTFYSKYSNFLMYIYFGLTFISTFIYLIYKRRRK